MSKKNINKFEKVNKNRDFCALLKIYDKSL